METSADIVLVRGAVENIVCFFFFQAEDGIRDLTVTGVQTCALPIFEGGAADVPSATNNRASNYAGGQISLGVVKGNNNAKVGIYAFGQHDNTLFGLIDRKSVV